jgi:dihydroorotase
VVIVRGHIERLAPRVWSEETAKRAKRPGTWRVDGTGAFIAPGFIDLHAHLRDFGEAQQETIASGAEAAAAGGFTTVVAMANTDPPIDSVTALAAFAERAAKTRLRVLPVAAVTRGLEGRELTDFEALAAGGAVAFSDDGRNAYDTELAVAAIRRASALDRPVLVHAQDEATCPDGQVDPAVAKRVGVKPWPCAAEAAAVERAIDACREADGRVHIQHVSCAASVKLIREAKRAGLQVTAEVTPHHLVLTADRVLTRHGKPDVMAKVNPPLRPAADREARVAALADGVIDAVATDHAPHDAAGKSGDFAEASFGISGFETALALCLRLVDTNQITLRRLVESLTLGPWRCLGEAAGIPKPQLREEQLADLVLFDNKGLWTVDSSEFVSRGRNTPLEGEELMGRVLLTMAAGHPVRSRWFAGQV